MIASKKAVLMAAAIASLSIGRSQETFTCGASKKIQEVYAQHPELERDQQALLEQSKQSFLNERGDREEVFVIPVVFHIIHENGVENISDAQVYDQVEILNRDFRLLNADTSDIVPAFKPIAADAQIEFRLANLDPFGNCTNGIEHIYSHETNIGDDYSKLNRWPRTRYLNVWVVKSMENGVAGYAYYPSAVSTSLDYADGIIIRHNFIGSIGTGSPFNSRALTHEIGHWLGLPHVWGSTNSPEIACGDDGIIDTPETAGHSSCNLVATDNCNAGVEENVQNYMEYSYCSRMFTQGQKEVMNTTLMNSISSRNNLPLTSNLESTGVIDPPVLCTAKPAFYSDYQVICSGKTVQYYSSTSRAIVDTYEWVFEGGTPATSTDMNPQVTYSTPGQFNVTLKVTNTAGEETELKEGFVHVFSDYWLHEGTYLEDFDNDNFNTQAWIVLNPEENDSKWELIEGVEDTDNKCIGIKYFKDNPDPILNPFYDERLGGTTDILISPSYNISQVSNGMMSFKYSFTSKNGGIYSPTAKLRISYMKDCESTWNLLTLIDENDLEVTGYYGTSYLPDDNTIWENVNIPLGSPVASTNVKFKFEFTTNDHSNNFFLDDLNISGTVGLEAENSIQNLSVYPNPTSTNQGFVVTYYSTNEETVAVSITDILGKEVFNESYESTIGTNKNQVDLSTTFHSFSTGIYTVKIKKGDVVFSERLVIQ